MDRHGLSALAMTRVSWVRGICHCEEETQVTDAAIHRVSGDADGFVCSLTDSQWIATGIRPRDDNMG